MSGAPGWTGEGVEPLGYCDLDGRPVFKLAIQVVGERWYLWATHFWEPRLSVLDVTDPTRPTVVGAVEGPEGSATWQVQVADGVLVQGLEHRPVAWGGDPDSQAEEGVRLYDVRDPLAPALLGSWRTGAHGTHRNHWTGGRYVHLAASQPGYEGNVYVVLDVQDPAHPRAVGRWALPEQEEGRGTGRRVSLHGPAYVDGDRAYLPYGAAGMVVLDVSDVTAPQLVSRLDIGAAFSSTIAMHTAVPRPRRGLVLVNTEAIAERSQEPYNFAGVVDVSDERAPRLLSLLPPPVPPASAPYPNHHTRGGRYGPHNQHHPQGPHLFDSDTLVFMTWFNAGLRVYDTSDPYVPREVAWFLPDDPTVRRGLLPRDLVTQSEDVLVDARGVVYVSDKNHGLHVLTLPGLAEAAQRRP